MREANLFVAKKKRRKTPLIGFGIERMDITADLTGTKRETREKRNAIYNYNYSSVPAKLIYGMNGRTP